VILNGVTAYFFRGVIQCESICLAGVSSPLCSFRTRSARVAGNGPAGSTLS